MSFISSQFISIKPGLHQKGLLFFSLFENDLFSLPKNIIKDRICFKAERDTVCVCLIFFPQMSIVHLSLFHCRPVPLWFLTLFSECPEEKMRIDLKAIFLMCLKSLFSIFKSRSISDPRTIDGHIKPFFFTPGRETR